MKYKKLSNTDLSVSLICLGTMTYGEQNNEREAHEQLDYSLSEGVNFIDTAEMYAIPPKEETQGRTEEIIGTWLSTRSDREKIIVATKVAGPGMEYLRGGSRLDKKSIFQAIDESLKRLKTDYIDLYQVHWPERKSNYFGRLGYQYTEDMGVPIEETLEAMSELVKSGKVRYIGISNETPWGVMKYLQLSKEKNLPRMMSIQNVYSLVNRVFDIHNSEVSIRENCGLLAYSPLAGGRLSGKYVGGKNPKKARYTLWPRRFSRHHTERGENAIEKYVNLAHKHSIAPSTFANAFVNDRPFVTSNIIGATTMEQLKENIDSIDITLTDDILQEIEDIHLYDPNPCV